MDTAIINETCEQFLGQWKRLVSTTNWDKGRIICEWRAALEATDAPAGESSDDAWSQRVSNVTPQHVGRLRRVFERFGQTYSEYQGLYWSHFQAALDWHDAEMWLEGAVQSEWSISQMRRQRAEANGGVDDSANEDESIAAELDEDAGSEDREPSASGLTSEVGQVRAPRDRSESDADDDDDSDNERAEYEDDDEPAATPDSAHSRTAPPARPFANLPSLPGDVTDAFEAYKLCILRHKLSGWGEISRDDLIASLDALKELALTEPEE